MKPDVSIVPERPKVELDPQRCFTPRQKAQIFKRAKGRCELCGAKIFFIWTAGHIKAHSKGGPTHIDNGRVECPSCAVETHSEDTTTAAKAKRMAGITGQQARRAKNGSRLKSRGFDKTLRKKFNGEVERK